MIESTKAPVLLTRERVTVLLACVLVALGSGTNYVYSAYAPQLGARLQINHTRLNMIGLGGNIGVYTTAPLFGRMADRRGPKGLLTIGFTFLFLGYMGIRTIYNMGVPEDGELPAWRFYALVLCSFLTGVGGNGGLCSSLNTASKSFPDRTRATVNGLVLSGFGLSAFFFSTLAHTFFHDDTSAFILLLAVGTSFPMLIGLWLVRPIPPSLELELLHGPKHHRTRSLGSTRPVGRRDDSSTRLLPRSSLDHAVDIDAEQAISLPSHTRSASPTPGKQHKLHIGELADVPGKDLWRYPDFWLLFAIMTLCSGTGLMYINNVGSISQALYTMGKTVLTPGDAKRSAQWQAAQVSAVSVANCLGRITIGITADFVHNTLALRRAYCLALVASMFLLSQISLYYANEIETLWHTSGMLGLAYGGLFGLCPTIMGEWFGLAHFSENWGFLSLSPLFGGNAFSLAFGRDLDSHAISAPIPIPSPTLTPMPTLAPTPTATTATAIIAAVGTILPKLAAVVAPVVPATTLSHISAGPVGVADALTRATSHLRNTIRIRGGVGSDTQCLLGPACYESSVRMTMAATAIALGLSVWAGVRDRRKAMKVEEDGILEAEEDEEGEGEVLWEEGR